MRQCPRCSSKFADDLSFCRLCGAELPKPSEEPPVTAAVATTPLPEVEEAIAETIAPVKINVTAPVIEVQPPAAKPQLRLEPVPKPSVRQCIQCGSAKVIPNVMVHALVSDGKGKLQVYVDAVPDALVFKERMRADIVAEICGECGHVSLKAKDAAGLYYHYLNSQKPR